MEGVAASAGTGCGASAPSVEPPLISLMGKPDSIEPAGGGASFSAVGLSLMRLLGGRKSESGPTKATPTVRGEGGAKAEPFSRLRLALELR